MTVKKALSSNWEPPSKMPRESVVKTSEAVLGLPDIKVGQNEDIFRIHCLGMEWDMGVMVYEPENTAKVPVGADGKKVGIFLLHGGAGDYKSMEAFALLFANKFGFKVMTMTFPGRLYLLDPSRDWPGDTLNPDGTVRTPIWQKEEQITPDQYEVKKDLTMRFRYGTRTVARAKPGTPFYYRMAAWPVAFEEAMKDANRRHFPENEFSIYVHGHSTGGPLVSMISQRIPNIAGVIAVENSTFGYIEEQKHGWSGALGKIPGYDRVNSGAKMNHSGFGCRLHGRKHRKDDFLVGFRAVIAAVFSQNKKKGGHRFGIRSGYFPAESQVVFDECLAFLSVHTQSPGGNLGGFGQGGNDIMGDNVFSLELRTALYFFPGFQYFFHQPRQPH